MRIGISALYQLQGGTVPNLRQLIRSWSGPSGGEQHQIVLFTRSSSVPLLEDVLPSTVEVRVMPQWHRWATPRRLVWEQVRFPRLLARERLDVLFCTGNLVPLWSPVPTVVVFHNAAPFCPTIRPSTVGLRRWSQFLALGAVMRLSANRATRVVFLSRFLRDIFVERYGFRAERGDLIYQGRDALDGAPPLPPNLGHGEIRGPYLLFVSHLYPYKNVLELLEGFARICDAPALREMQLVVVGKATDAAYFRRIETLVRERRLGGRVVFTGGVEHGAIRELLERCEAYVFQSTCENCPNSLIEALSMGLPIACSRAGVMPEIAGDAVHYFDPFDPEDIGRALMRVVSDPQLRRELQRRAQLRAVEFPTWTQVAEMTLASLRRAAVGVARTAAEP